MYNLLISSNSDAWDGAPFTYERGRCVREYTDDDLTERFKDLDQQQIRDLQRLPSIFAYEAAQKKDPVFGRITAILPGTHNVKVKYDIQNIGDFIAYEDLEELRISLDIGRYELNRTHWAVKDIDLSRVLSRKGIELPYWALNQRDAIDIDSHRFKVALSFPGEQRPYVEEVVGALAGTFGRNDVFYDLNYQAQLARPSLHLLLQSIYKDRSDLVVVFVCDKYQEKEWCGVEFRAIGDLLFDRNLSQVMYVKMDSGEVDGVLKTDGYIDGQRYSPDEVAGFIEQRFHSL